MKCKAITIHQPWAWAIAEGIKTVENRTWATSYRGPIAIHAGKSMASIEEGTRFIESLGYKVPTFGDEDFGAIIAVANLVDCVKVDEDPLGMFGVRDNPFAQGPVCWVLSDVRKLAEPVACNGKQGLWEVEVKCGTAA